MSLFERVQVLVSPVRHMRGVANLATLYPERGEPFGLNNRGKPATGSMILRSFERMAGTEFDREPHYSFYVIVDEDGDPLEKAPRLQKVALGQVREIGHDVLMWGVGVDFDLKDHPSFQTNPSIPRGKDGKKITWDSLDVEQTDEIMQVLNKVSDRLAEQGLPWNYCHSSNGGVHFVHVLPMLVPAGLPFEQLAARIRDAYVVAGLQVDASCKDWTRLFKCPRVTLNHDSEDEDPILSWEADWFWEEAQEDEFTIPEEDDLRPAESDSLVIVAAPREFERPCPEDARALVEELDEGGKMKLTAAGKSARQAILATECDYAGAIFDAEFPLATENRHTTLLAAVGQVIASVHGFPWASAELVYGLLLPAAEDLGRDDNGLRFTDQLWENTTTFWAREDSKAAARQAENSQRAERERARVRSQDPAVRESVTPDDGQDPGDTSGPPELDETLFAGNVRLWLPDAHGLTHSEIRDLIQARKLGVLVDQKRDNCHVLLPSGFYDASPCSTGMVRKVVEERGMEWLVPIGLMKENERGDLVRVPFKKEKIVEESARTFAEVDFTLRHGGSHLRVDESGRGILNLVPFGLRQDLVDSRELVPECVEWMRLSVEDDKADLYLKAVAYLAAIYWGPTAAVALIGPKGIGKSMLGEAFADMVTTRRTVPGDVVLMKHNDALLWSPFIHIDEGLRRSGDGIDFGDVFRRIVAGGPVAVEPKGMPLMRCAGIHRVLITANNTDTLVKIAGSRARGEDDWEAIAERLAVFRAQDRAAEFLAARGGLDFTRSWVGPGSQHKLARTILALLYDEIEWEDDRPKRMGARFLYEGNADEGLIRDMEAEATGIPEVVRAVNKLLDRKGQPAAVIENGRVYVMCEKVIALAGETSKIGTSELRAALRSMLYPDQPDGRITVAGKQQRWKFIDLERFVGLLDRIGEPPARAFTGRPAPEEVDA